jgi:methylmalonyl-CoA mutase
MGWDVRAEIHQPTPEEAGQAALDELNGGASSLLLRFDERTRLGNDALGVGGIACESLADLQTVLAHVPLGKTPIALDAGVQAFPLAVALLSLARERRVGHAELSGSLGIDPLGALAQSGRLTTSLETAYDELADVLRYCRTAAPQLRAALVDTSAHHEAGAEASTEIAIALATGIALLRALEARGVSVDEACAQLAFRFSIGRDFFLEIAKLRAARRCWARVVEACGGSASAQAMVLHAVTSRRTKTQRDPWVNVLRATAESFSAAAGGADAITTLGFDVALGASDELSRRLSRNTQHLLRHESNVHRVVDPAGGSFYLEHVTEALAARAWVELQAIERAGGIGHMLTVGALQAQLAETLDRDRKAVETRKIAITGVNEFPNVREERVTRSPADARALAARATDASTRGRGVLSALAQEPNTPLQGAMAALARGAALFDLRAALGTGGEATVKPLVRARLSAPFEALRDEADRLGDRANGRPRVFLANMGPIAQHKARAMFAQNFLEAAGFEAVTNDGFTTADAAAAAFAESGALACAICSSDELYAELATSTAEALRARGAKIVILAGQPGAREAAYREAGVTDFIAMGVNVYETLRSLLERVGAA